MQWWYACPWDACQVVRVFARFLYERKDAPGVDTHAMVTIEFEDSTTGMCWVVHGVFVHLAVRYST